MKDLVGPGNISLTNCGQIIIKKRSNPRGLDQAFGFTSNIAGAQLTCTADTTPAAFSLNDKDNSGTSDSAGNTENCTNVPAGSYTVTEGANPSGFAFGSLSCTASGTGSSGGQDSTIVKQANITIAGGGVVTCTYTNNQQLGAIKVSKTSTKGSTALSGATFSIKVADENGAQVTGSPATTGSDGTACVGNLPFGVYSVKETAAPAGYQDRHHGRSVSDCRQQRKVLRRDVCRRGDRLYRHSRRGDPRHLHEHLGSDDGPDRVQGGDLGYPSHQGRWDR